MRTDSDSPLAVCLRAGAILALLALVLEFGFPLSESVTRLLHLFDIVVVILFIFDLLIRWSRARSRPAFLRSAWLECALLLIIAVQFSFDLGSLQAGKLTRVYVVIAQTYLVARLLIAAARANEKLLQTSVSPAALLVGSFLLLILAGSVLLWMPLCRTPNAAPWSWTDALFTSTSACCVTGLSVRDVGLDLSLRGQIVLLILIQIGGLGLATLAMLFTYLRSRRLRLNQATFVRDILSLDTMANLGTFLLRMVAVTLLAEALGSVILMAACQEAELDAAGRWWWGLFHAVSAFCNAGFGLESDNFMHYAGAGLVSTTLCALVILGGLGFPVIADLLSLRLGGLPWFRRRAARKGVDIPGPPTRLALHSKLVLSTTLLLLTVGTLLFFLSEARGTLAGRPFAEQVYASVFQAVMPRTAGFNSLDMTRLTEPTLILIMLLMVIGASPCSTGGGVKTTASAVIFFLVRSILRNRDSIDAFGRSIPRRAVHAAIATLVLYMVSLLLITTALCMTQPGPTFRDLLFETVSALSTVGLSIGVTAQVDDVGRLLLCLAMLIGRVGPLSVVWAVVSQPPALRYEYPEESVMVS